MLLRIVCAIRYLPYGLFMVTASLCSCNRSQSEYPRSCAARDNVHALRPDLNERLRHASTEDDVYGIDKYISLGANVNATDRIGRTALCFGCS